MNTLDILIVHIISQLSFRYLTVNIKGFSPERTDLVFWSRSWKAYLQRYQYDESKPWFLPLNRLLDGKIEIIERELFLIFQQFPSKIKFISILSPEYPYLLKQIHDPPLILFYRGNDYIFQLPCISVIGSRKASSIALKEAKKYSAAFVKQGAAIVSGGALGCDAAAHEGSWLEAKQMMTVVVMAGGVDNLYPKANQKLFEDVLLHGGLIISERLPGTKPKPRDFPIRNRIIAGLSSRTVIIQAARRSGAMATANIALNQGRDVLVFDVGKNDIRFQGNQTLIESGADNYQSIEQCLLLF